MTRVVSVWTNSKNKAHNKLISLDNDHVGMQGVGRGAPEDPHRHQTSLRGPSSPPRFGVGEVVCVTEEWAKLRVAQEGHGGFNPRMVDYIGKRGVVHRVTEKG